MRAAVLAAAAVAALACARQPEAPPGRAEPVAVHTAAEPATATTGDRILYRVEVAHDPAIEVEIPEAETWIGGLEVLDAGRSGRRGRSGRMIEERWYELRADLVGAYELPPPEIAWRPAGADDGSAEGGIARGEPVTVEVVSVLPADGSATDIRDIKPLRRTRAPLPWGWIAGGAALVVAVLGLLAWLRRRRAGDAPGPAVPAEPPHVIARRALEALRGVDPADAAAVRRYFFALSETVRVYVEGRFGLNATDLTTEEIVAALGGRTPFGRAPRRTLELPGDAADLLRRFLVDSDRVKFADHRPEAAEIAGAWERARGFVEATEPREEPAEPPGEAAA